jgi:hypothetical protein
MIQLIQTQDIIDLMYLHRILPMDKRKNAGHWMGGAFFGNYHYKPLVVHSGCSTLTVKAISD